MASQMASLTGTLARQEGALNLAVQLALDSLDSYLQFLFANAKRKCPFLTFPALKLSSGLGWLDAEADKWMLSGNPLAPQHLHPSRPGSPADVWESESLLGQAWSHPVSRYKMSPPNPTTFHVLVTSSIQTKLSRHFTKRNRDKHYQFPANV